MNEYDPASGMLLGELINDLDNPNSIYVDSDGDLIITDQGFSNPEDKVYLYPADGSPRRILIDGMTDPLGGLSTPYQISRLQNGNLGMAVFSQNSIRIFQDGFPTIDNLVIGNNPGTGNPYLPRGIWPLTNGSFLISANNGGGVSTFDPFMVNGGGVNNELPGSTYRFFGSACLPN